MPQKTPPEARIYQAIERLGTPEQQFRIGEFDLGAPVQGFQETPQISTQEEYDALPSGAEYIGPGMPWIDPLKELQAYELAMDRSLMTREQVIVELGRNPRDVPEAEPTEPATVLEVVEDEDQPDTGTA